MKLKPFHFLGICFVISVSTVLLYRHSLTAMQKIATPSGQSTAGISYEIDPINYSKNYVQISGWAVRNGAAQSTVNWITGPSESVYTNNSIVIEDEHHSLYKLHTFSMDEPHIAGIKYDGIRFCRYGVYAKVRCSDLKRGQIYKVGILLKDNTGKQVTVFSDKVVKL